MKFLQMLFLLVFTTSTFCLHAQDVSTDSIPEIGIVAARTSVLNGIRNVSEGAMYWNTDTDRVECNVGDKDSSIWKPAVEVLPHLSIQERDALNPESGQAIYNKDMDRVERFVNYKEARWCKVVKRKEEIFSLVEQRPCFPGCENVDGKEKERIACTSEKSQTYIDAYLQYPTQAKEDGIEGVVVIQTIVDLDGSFTEIEIVRDLGGGTGVEAKRIIQSMEATVGKWMVGRQRGRPVRVLYKLPVHFTLPDNEKYLLVIDGKQEDKYHVNKMTPDKMALIQGECIKSTQLLKQAEFIKKYDFKGQGIIDVVTTGKIKSLLEDWNKRKKRLEAKGFRFRYFDRETIDVSFKPNIDKPVTSTVYDLDGQVVHQQTDNSGSRHFYKLIKLPTLTGLLLVSIEYDGKFYYSWIFKN